MPGAGLEPRRSAPSSARRGAGYGEPPQLHPQKGIGGRGLRDPRVRGPPRPACPGPAPGSSIPWGGENLNAGGGTRTRKGSLPEVFETSASATSATPARPSHATTAELAASSRLRRSRQPRLRRAPGDHPPHPSAIPYPAACGARSRKITAFVVGHSATASRNASPPPGRAQGPGRPALRRPTRSGAGSGLDHHRFRSPGAGQRVANTPAWSEGQSVTVPTHGSVTVMRSLGSSPMTLTTLRPPNPAFP